MSDTDTLTTGRSAGMQHSFNIKHFLPHQLALLIERAALYLFCGWWQLS